MLYLLLLDQEINEHAFKSLTESMVKELLPTKIDYRYSVLREITDLNNPILTNSNIAVSIKIIYTFLFYRYL